MSPAHSWLPSVADAVVANSTSLVPYVIKCARIGMDDRRLGTLAWIVVSTIETLGGVTAPAFTLASMFTTSLEVTNGSAATALSTILTIMSSMAYYDEFANLEEIAQDTTTVFFETMLFSQSFRGLTAVLAITTTHYLLVVIITAAFVTSTRFTTLGDHWQNISQIISPATSSFLEGSSCATDKEVCRFLKAEGKERETANIQFSADGDRGIGLVARKAHQD